MADEMSTFDGRIIHPYRMLICGPSSAGKSSWVHRLIEKSEDLVDEQPTKIFWFHGIQTREIRENKSDHGGINYVQGIPNDFEDFIDPGHPPTLFIFDDLMQQAVNNKAISNLFTRQSHHMNISVILILQDLFYNGSERKTFFRNAQYLVLFSSPLDKSGIYAIANKIMPKRIQTFLNVFEMATRQPFGYLFIDGKQSTPSDARLRTDIFKPYQRVFVPQ